MEVKVLGPVEATVGPRPVAVSAHQRLIIAVLAANAGNPVPADVLIEAVWSDRLPSKPLAALQNLISRLRTRLPADRATAIGTAGSGYLLDPTACSIDSMHFERALQEARRDADAVASMAAYRAALEAWRGAAYGELADRPELAAHAHRLEELAAVAREELAALMTGLDPVGAVIELEALVARQPFRERGHALLMEALHRCHRQRDALAVFRDYERFLGEELGLAPSPALRELESLILTDALDQPARHAGHRLVDAVVTAGPATAIERIHNLPERLTSFVGRDEDLAAVSAALTTWRLVSVVGAGGAGKTSLATEAARTLLGDRFQRVFVVDLLTMVEGRHLPELVAAVLGLGALDADDPVRALTDALHGEPVLLVLDNCEHLVEAAAVFADALLRRTAAVRIVATSRVPLQVAGEMVYRLAPLGLPAAGVPLDAVLDSPAGRLLADRVVAADSTVTLLDSDADAIVAICERLDGLPLALELAAARAPMLGLSTVAARLDDRYGLLTRRSPAGAPHHQTLRAAIAWSADLLDERQRRLLADLAVFVGGFDLEAAESVCADSIASDDVGALLASLVEQSLVTVERHHGAVRYRLLETVREFARSELGQREAAVRHRHWHWARGLAASIGDGFLVHTSAWYRRLRVEFPNLRTAYQWSLEQGDAIGALDIAASLRWAPFNTGHLYAEHGEWVETALRTARREAVDGTTVARGLVASGAFAGLESRSAAAVQLLREAVHVLDAADQPGEVVWCYMWLAAFLSDLGDHAEAVGHSGRGLAVAEQTGDAAALTYLANQHGEVAMSAWLLEPAPHRFDVACEAFDVAARTAAAHGIEEGRVRAAHGAALLTATIDAEDSIRRCRDALAWWRRLGLGNRLIMGLVGSARVALLAGHHAECDALVVEAATAIGQVGWRQPLGRLLETAAVSARHTGNLPLAARLAGAADARFRTPRWYVPLDEAACLAAARALDPATWEREAAAGRRLTDGEVMALLRTCADRPTDGRPPR